MLYSKHLFRKSVDEEKPSTDKVTDAAPDASSPPVGDIASAGDDNALKTKAKAESPEMDQSEKKHDGMAENDAVENVVENGNINTPSVPEATKKLDSGPSADSPTNDEHENQVIEEEEIIEPDTKEQTDNKVEAA